MAHAAGALPRLIGELPRATARRLGSRTAVVAGDRALGYDELDEHSDRFANALSGIGIAAGDRIGIFLRNIAEYPIAYFGIAKAGAVSVHIPLRFVEGEFDYALRRTPLAALVIEDSMTQQIAWAAPHLPPSRIIHVGARAAPSFADLVARASAVAPAIAVAEESAGLILFTSGTTGYPKGALQPHYGRCLSAQVAIADFGLTDKDVLAVASPLYHAAGLLTWYQSGVAAGACAVLLPTWDPVTFMEAVERHSITGAFAVPAQLAMLLRHPNFDPLRLRNLRIIVYGGAPSDPKLIAELARALPGVRLVQNYGMTEIGPLFSQGPEDRLVNPSALGRPNTTLEVELFAEPGRPAATGEPGEIATRGPHVMLGYYGDEQATHEFFRSGDGWGWTGDLAVRDENGMITLVGRTRDTIISGAVNIYPSELERVAKQHPGVADCAAFGLPDDIWGELPAIAVVPVADAAIREVDLLALFEGTTARFKRPRQVFFVESLPYTPAGKLQRGELRKQFGKKARPTQEGQ
jgi:acyl-CoA synthetase (AMP-forming)/AMP-acid ligase II